MLPIPQLSPPPAVFSNRTVFSSDQPTILRSSSQFIKSNSRIQLNQSNYAERERIYLRGERKQCRWGDHGCRPDWAFFPGKWFLGNLGENGVYLEMKLRTSYTTGVLAYIEAFENQSKLRQKMRIWIINNRMSGENLNSYTFFTILRQRYISLTYEHNLVVGFF